MFISFEGIDGSGKSTQIELLSKKLSDDGHSVHVFREPGGTDLSEEVRGLLLDSDLPIDPVSELLLFSAARAQLISEKVKPILEKDNVVILDRYYDSTVAYQGFGRSSLPLEDIHKLNVIASHGIEPDVTFYLELPLEEAFKRTQKQVKDRMELSGSIFYKQVIKGFEAIAKTENRFKRIDASGSPEHIHGLIIRELKNAGKGSDFKGLRE